MLRLTGLDIAKCPKCGERAMRTIKEQHKMLSSKLRGYYQYYGIRGNFKMLEVVFEHTERAWRRWLGRRCSKGYVTADEFHEYHRKVFPLQNARDQTYYSECK